MKTEEIIAGNRLLAEFMTGQKPESTVFFGLNCTASGLKFNSSWDWLMPVVEKIESLEYDVEIGTEYIRIEGASNNQFSMDSWTGGPKIDAVFQACVEFAEWYKNQAK